MSLTAPPTAGHPPGWGSADGRATADTLGLVPERVVFVQLTTGHGTDRGPCWISRVTFSRTCGTPATADASVLTGRRPDRPVRFSRPTEQPSLSFVSRPIVLRRRNGEAPVHSGQPRRLDSGLPRSATAAAWLGPPASLVKEPLTPACVKVTLTCGYQGQCSQARRPRRRDPPRLGERPPHRFPGVRLRDPASRPGAGPERRPSRARRR